jgi:6-phosphofructokinase
VQLSGTGALGDLLGDLIKAKTKIKRVRADTLGYLQRSFLGCVSETDANEAREVGEKAVQYAVWHSVDGSVAIKRVGEYAVEYELLKLTDVAAKTKVMADEFINAEGNGVTEAFLNYARPLVGELAIMDRIAAPMVYKIKGGE